MLPRGQLQGVWGQLGVWGVIRDGWGQLVVAWGQLGVEGAIVGGPGDNQGAPKGAISALGGQLPGVWGVIKARGGN